MKSLPMSQGRVVAKGTVSKMAQAVGSDGTAQTIDSTEFQEFFVPEGSEFNGALIMVQIATLSGYDPEDNHLPFYWSGDDPETETTAVTGNFPWSGMSAGIAKKEGESLGFFKAAVTGAKVVLWYRE